MKENALLACSIYAEKYSDSRYLKCFENLKERFERTANLNYPKSIRSKNVLNEEIEFEIVSSFMEGPESSIREMSKNLDIGKSSVAHYLKNDEFHPFHVQ